MSLANLPAGGEAARGEVAGRQHGDEPRVGAGGGCAASVGTCPYLPFLPNPNPRLPRSAALPTCRTPCPRALRCAPQHPPLRLTRQAVVVKVVVAAQVAVLRHAIKGAGGVGAHVHAVPHDQLVLLEGDAAAKPGRGCRDGAGGWGCGKARRVTKRAGHTSRATDPGRPAAQAAEVSARKSGPWARGRQPRGSAPLTTG